MAYEYSEWLNDIRTWTRHAADQGWLDAGQAQDLLEIDHQCPENLFNSDTRRPSRPLIVALMGGTGVGKSTLLNRLAGKAVAKTGIERPTSREVTLYLHESIDLGNLPERLPLDKLSVSRHQDVAQQNIVWIDMPDFDSVELANKHQVLQWLPYIDVLLYVVSPERYRDGKAWQMLLAEGGKHGWLFVMNQWDRGQTPQFDDFKRQLALAGFDDPLLFRTICSQAADDDFGVLLQHLSHLAGSHDAKLLEQHNRQVRQHSVTQRLIEQRQQLTNQNFNQLNCQYCQHWQQTVATLDQGLAWPSQRLADAIAAGRTEQMPLWDDWAQNRFDDLLDELTLIAVQCEIPTKPLKTELFGLKDQAKPLVERYAQQYCRQALLNPGNRLHRLALTGLRVAETVLPLAAMSAVGYRVFLGYYQSANASDPYLGSDFAIHSILLIALSWLIPYFSHKKLQPSLQKAARSGVRKGLTAAWIKLDRDITAHLQELADRHRDLTDNLTKLIAQGQQNHAPAQYLPASTLRRMINH